MDINSIGVNSNFYIDETKQSGKSNRSSEAGRPNMPPPRPPDNFQMSGMGQILNTVKDNELASKEEVKSFMDIIMEAVKNGTFNAKTFAENAPDWLVKAAEESGVSLEDALNSMANDIKSFGQRGPGQRQEMLSVKQPNEDTETVQE